MATADLKRSPYPNRTKARGAAPRISRARKVVLLLLTVAAISLAAAAVFVAATASSLPSVAGMMQVPPSPVTRIESSDGVVLGTVRTEYNRPIKLEQMSPTLVQATLATEDRRFYQHHGVDWRGVFRALAVNARSGRANSQGGSTITQQLARNLYLTRTKTFRRKIEEALLARRIEGTYSKHDILQTYLNTIYYGGGNYGIEAAARSFFGKPAQSLSLPQAALLAGLPQRPSAFSPVLHPDAALARQRDVLRRMVEMKYITPDQAAAAGAAALHVRKPHIMSPQDWHAPYVVAHILSMMKRRFGPESVYSGMRIVTTINWKMQKAAEAALRAGIHRGAGPSTGALVSLDPKTGWVRALVGGANFQRDQYDAAVHGARQPGSAFKPIMYAAAFENNVLNLATVMKDEPVTYEGGRRPWTVHNYDGRYRGPVTVLDAIKESINTIAVQTAQATGVDTVIDVAQRAGISTPLQANLPLALGASAVRPIDLCSAYSMFANNGARYDPTFVLEIYDRTGQQLYHDSAKERLHPGFLNSSTLDQVNVALREVALHGTGAAAASIPDAHGKTGTTSSLRDAWFVGYTGDLATAVWMAHSTRHVRHRKGGGDEVSFAYRSMPGATGGAVCAPVWKQYMRSAGPLIQKINLARHIRSQPIAQPAADQMLVALEQNAGATLLGQAASEKAQEARAQHEAALAAAEQQRQISQAQDSGDRMSNMPPDVNSGVYSAPDDSRDTVLKPDGGADSYSEPYGDAHSDRTPADSPEPSEEQINRDMQKDFQRYRDEPGSNP